MGVSKNPTQLAAKFGTAAVAIGGANRVAVNAAALVAKNAYLAAATPDTGGDLRLSRWGKKGLKLGVRYNVTTVSTDMSVARVTPRPAGPWRVLEEGASRHMIVPGASLRARRAGASLDEGAAGPVLPSSNVAASRRGRQSRRVLSFGPDKVAAYAQHPGSKPKNTWSKGTEAARPLATNTYQKAHRSALVGVFR